MMSCNFNFTGSSKTHAVKNDLARDFGDFNVESSFFFFQSLTCHVSILLISFQELGFSRYNQDLCVEHAVKD